MHKCIEPMQRTTVLVEPLFCRLAIDGKNAFGIGIGYAIT